MYKNVKTKQKTVASEGHVHYLKLKAYGGLWEVKAEVAPAQGYG